MGLFSSIGKAIGGVVGGLTGSSATAKAAQQAANIQAGSAQAGIDESRRQFDAMQALLAPFVSAGTTALSGQKDLLGLNGASAQGSAIDAIAQSPQMQALLARGENSILQNASATGGLRGGNTQAALAQFSPALLSQLIDQQYSRLGGLSGMGQSAASMTGNAGLQTGSNIANLLQQQGAAQAGGLLTSARINQAAIGQGLGFLGGNLNVFGGSGGQPAGSSGGGLGSLLNGGIKAIASIF